MFSQRLSDSNTPVDSFLLGPTEGLWASIMFCWEIATDVKGFWIFHFATSPIIQVPTSRIFKEAKFESTQEAHRLHTRSILYEKREYSCLWCDIMQFDSDVPLFRMKLSTSLYGITSHETVIFRKYINFSITFNSNSKKCNNVSHYINHASQLTMQI